MKSSAKTDPNCPLCVAWGTSPCMKAFERGEGVPASDAHSCLVLGWWLAKTETTSAGAVIAPAGLIIRGLCATHQRQCDFLTKAKTEGEMHAALAESKR